jgi:hypothetical protein
MPDDVNRTNDQRASTEDDTSSRLYDVNVVIESVFPDGSIPVSRGKLEVVFLLADRLVDDIRASLKQSSDTPRDGSERSELIAVAEDVRDRLHDLRLTTADIHNGAVPRIKKDIVD